jgi:hypothetical protein
MVGDVEPCFHEDAFANFVLFRLAEMSDFPLMKGQTPPNFVCDASAGMEMYAPSPAPNI